MVRMAWIGKDAAESSSSRTTASPQFGHTIWLGKISCPQPAHLMILPPHAPSPTQTESITPASIAPLSPAWRVRHPSLVRLCTARQALMLRILQAASARDYHSLPA